MKTFNVLKNPSGLSYGNLSRRVFARYAVIASEYEWVYGTAPRKEFPPHRRLNGKRYSGPDDETLACFGSWPPVTHYSPGDHLGCFPAGTLVEGCSVRGTTLRDYQGAVIDLVFASGQFLTTTPNHPILTPHGWMAAGFLYEGSDVLRCVDAKRIAGLIPNDYQRPTLIEDVVNSFGVALGMVPRRVPVSPEDFHGDGIGSQVAIVRTKSPLGDGHDIEFQEQASEQSLSSGRPGVMLATKGRLAPLLKRALPTPSSSMSRSGHELAFLGRGSRVPKRLGFAQSTNGDAALSQASVDGVSANPILFSELLSSLASAVASDQVVEIHMREIVGHVYNLETETGWYIANGIIVHNCSCGSIPKLVTSDGVGLFLPE